MVAPFRSKVPAETLAGTLDSVTLGTDAFDLGPLEVSLLEPGFPALVPKRVPRALTDLEERLVKTFSALSLPIEPDDLARREPLTVRQRALAKKWGYPYVLDQFRYHLTLGDPLTEKEEGMGRDRLNYLDLLRSLLTGEVTSGLRLDSLCLCRQASRGAPFRVISVSGFRPGQEPRPQGDEARPCDDIAPDRLERPYAPEFSEADLPGLK
jgi:hypothetical protein